MPINLGPNFNIQFDPSKIDLSKISKLKLIILIIVIIIISAILYLVYR